MVAPVGEKLVKVLTFVADGTLLLRTNGSQRAWTLVGLGNRKEDCTAGHLWSLLVPAQLGDVEVAKEACLLF